MGVPSKLPPLPDDLSTGSCLASGLDMLLLPQDRLHLLLPTLPRPGPILESSLSLSYLLLHVSLLLKPPSGVREGEPIRLVL